MPEHAFTANVSLVSDYRFRGISQSRGNAATQGGIDYSHASGAFLGTWASSVSADQYLGASGVEWDLYGGWRGARGNITADVGLLYYFYPSARLPAINPSGGNERYNTFEGFVRLSWRRITFEYWHALTDILGIQESTFGGACDRRGNDCFRTKQGGSAGSTYANIGAIVPVSGSSALSGTSGVSD